MNGKTIYKQTFSGDISRAANSSDMTVLSDIRVDELVSYGGWFDIGVSNIKYGVPSGGAENGRASEVSVGAKGNLRLGTKSELNRSSAPYQVWVEYTKI